MSGLDRVREAVRQARGDLTGEEIAAAFARANEAARRPGPDGTLLITAVVCRTCGFRVDVDLVGLLAAPVPTPLSIAGREPTVYEPTAAAQEAIHALQRTWTANYSAHGLCGHMVTIDATQELADSTSDEG